MSLAFHTVWLGGAVPLRNLLNLGRMLHAFERELPRWHALPEHERPYLPLLWLDHSAWQHLLNQSPLPVSVCAPSLVPPVWFRCASHLIGQDMGAVRWLRITIDEQTQHIPVLLLEDMREALARPWQDMQGLGRCLQVLATKQDGLYLQRELGLPSSLDQALHEFSGPEMLAWMEQLVDHCRRQWAAHGLLCLASDVLRLMALCWLPGAYGDLGDVVGRLDGLPTRARVHARGEGFCAHRTVAIENDLIFCQDRELVMAITWGTALWSRQAVQRVAERLHLDSNLSAQETLRAVLPRLDARLPAVPSLRELLGAPYTRLADYISMAYGSQSVFGHGATLQAFFKARADKQLLIDHIGGFTGYQKFAHCLVPDSAQAWAQCERQLGLAGYAPQLGWQSYGFGTIDRLVGHGQALIEGTVHTGLVRQELALMAPGMGVETSFMEPLAVLCYRLHGLLACAHFEPAKRHTCLSEAQMLCDSFERGG
jgi:hypothetical protein